MKKIKRIINCVIPITVCNFTCHYCYLAQTNSFDKNIPKLQYDISHIKRALSLKRLGGPCMVNMCAVGETLMAPYLADLVQAMLDNGHYVTIVTNGSIRKMIEKICQIDKKLTKRLFFKFSYQYLELKRLNLIDAFFANIKLVRDAGISYTVELTANDKAISFIDDIKNKCVSELGAMPHIIESRDNNKGLIKLTKLSNKEHMEKWNQFDTPLIKFQDTIWGEKRCEFCYAGDWVLNLYLESGNISPCFGGGPIIQNIFENIDEPIHFEAIGNKCPWEHCYAAYVLLTLGAIPELDTPKYSEIRNRKTIDNKEWLTKDMKSFMSSKFIESNHEYSQNKKEIINWYRDIELNGKECESNEFVKALDETLKARNIKSVAIYENEKYEKSLINGLLRTSIKVKYIISPNYKEYNNIKHYIIHQLKYVIKKRIRKEKVPILNYYDRLPNVDAIIVTDITNFDRIKKEIKEKIHKEAILITEIER